MIYKNSTDYMVITDSVHRHMTILFDFNSLFQGVTI